MQYRLHGIDIDILNVGDGSQHQYKADNRSQQTEFDHQIRAEPTQIVAFADDRGQKFAHGFAVRFGVSCFSPGRIGDQLQSRTEGQVVVSQPPLAARPTQWAARLGQQLLYARGLCRLPGEARRAEAAMSEHQHEQQTDDTADMTAVIGVQQLRQLFIPQDKQDPDQQAAGDQHAEAGRRRRGRNGSPASGHDSQPLFNEGRHTDCGRFGACRFLQVPRSRRCFFQCRDDNAVDFPQYFFAGPAGRYRSHALVQQNRIIFFVQQGNVQRAQSHHFRVDIQYLIGK